EDVYRVRLSVAPTANVTVNLVRDGAQLVLANASNTPITQITFTPTNWDQWVTVKVKAVDDTVRENSKVSRIVHSFTSTDVRYGQAADVEVEVRVLDNDSPNVLVTESDGGTFVVKGVSNDDYTLRLVSSPTAPVTVDIFGDGQTLVVSATRGGTQFRIDGGATVYKINDIVDVVDAATNAVTSSKLILTLDGSLGSIAN